jgi:hypothetical protein
VSVQGGANDIFGSLTGNPSPTPAAIASFATVTAGNEALNVQLAIQEGARTII